MKKFVLKFILYAGLMLIAFEILVRIFHLYGDVPPKVIDSYGVEHRKAGSTGHYVTGNRRQNFSAFSINSAGFNSFRDFHPKEDGYEIALVGDSFIEGFHQDYDNSLGKKIENLLEDVQVYEYGYTGASMAYQMHLVNAYKERLAKVDKIILYMKFKNDFNSYEHTADHALVEKLNTPLFKMRAACKLWVYGSRHGLVSPIKKVASGVFSGINFLRGKRPDTPLRKPPSTVEERIANFEKLIANYGFDKEKTALLLDSRVTNAKFLAYCEHNDIDYIDYSEGLKNAYQPTTLIYDMHWNDYGRSLIAKDIAAFVEKNR